jgi:hypothetical protein
VKEHTPIDKLIEPAVKRVAERETGYFQKNEIVTEVLKNKNLSGMLADIKKRFGGWKFDTVILRYIDGRVGQVLQQRDGNRIRVYECYAAGGRERRWLPLRAMTADTLLAVMRETRTQARQLEIKGEGYEFFYNELKGTKLTIEDVYDKVVPMIRDFRAGKGAA